MCYLLSWKVTAVKWITIATRRMLFSKWIVNDMAWGRAWNNQSCTHRELDGPKGKQRRCSVWGFFMLSTQPFTEQTICVYVLHFVVQQMSADVPGRFYRGYIVFTEHNSTSFSTPQSQTANRAATSPTLPPLADSLYTIFPLPRQSFPHLHLATSRQYLSFHFSSALSHILPSFLSCSE